MSKHRSKGTRALAAALGAVVLLLVGVAAAPPTQAQEIAGASTAGHRITFNAVYVVNGGQEGMGSLTVINADTNRVAGTIPLPDATWPHHIYLSPDRSRLAVAAPGRDLSGGHGEPVPGIMGEVIVLNARTGAILNRTGLLPMMNHNAAYSADGREIWTGQMAMPNGSVLVLDARTLAPKQQITVGAMPAEVTLTPDGKLFYVANLGSGDVTVINAATKQVVTTIPVGENPVGAWQATNGYAYVDNEHSQTVSAIKQRTLSVTDTFDLGFTPGMAKLGPDGHLWVTDSDNGRVVLYSLDTVARHEIPTGAGAHAIEFSRDGRTAYVTNQHADTLSIIDIRTRTVKKTLETGHLPNGLVFRPAR
jgi:YVTN family beta-propeller protein